MVIPKRLALATVFGALQLPTLLTHASSVYKQQDLRILIYHRVVDPQRAYDPANVSATPEQFARQLDHIARDYDVISFTDLLDAYSGDQKLPKRPLLITFDDGYADNYAFAFPALKHRSMSAAFFVTTDHIGQRELFWFDKVGFLLQRTRDTSWTLLDGRTINLVDRDHTAILKELLLILKAFPNEKRIEQIRVLEEKTLDGSENIDPINFPMTWDQLREMNEGGMEIYSHTCTHPVLSTLEKEEDIRRELARSKEQIEKQLGNACTVFAYPVGRRTSYDERTLRIVEECGYQIACINESGTNDLKTADKLELYRIPVDDFQNDASFKSLVAQPRWFSYQ